MLYASGGGLDSERDKSHYSLEFYTTHRGESLVDEFLDKLPLRHRTKILQWFEKLTEYGPNLPRPYADVLDGAIRELRIQFGHHHYRFLYFFHFKNIVLTHGFLKKTG